MRALFDTYGAMLGHAILVHTGYVLICVTVGFFLGLLLGVALSRTPRISGIVLPVISVFQTIPGLVFIGLLFLWLGMVPMTVIIALSIYAMFGAEKHLHRPFGCGEKISGGRQRLRHVSTPVPAAS